MLELHGTVMYEKPQITEVFHTLTDSRADGGSVVVRITMLGDPRLSASFDISPGIVDRQPMTETEAGSYVTDFSLPTSAVGGPFTIIGRLRHELAGEATRRDPEPLIITMVDRLP